MSMPTNFIALPMRSLPLVDIGGATVSTVGSPSILATEHGPSLLLSAGMSASAVLPVAVTDRLAICMWLRTGMLTPPVDVDGIPQEVQTCIVSGCTPEPGGGIPLSGWSFSRIQRIDGVSDFLFSVYDGAQDSHYRFVGNNHHEWQFVVLHMVATARESIFSVHVDGQALSSESAGSPASLDGLDTDRILCINCPQPPYSDGVIGMPSMGDFIHDIFITTDDIGDGSIIYEDISRLGVEAALNSEGQFTSVPTAQAPTIGIVGVAETGSGRFAVDSEGSYFSLQDVRFDVVRNLKLSGFPEDIVPYRITSGSDFSISPAKGVVLRGSGLRLL